MRKLIKNTLTLSLVLAVIFTVSGCKTGKCPMAKIRTPKIAFTLPANYASPDGMVIGPDNCIYLAINNAGIDFKFKNNGLICKITPDDQLVEVCQLPAHPETKKVSPLGLVFDKAGNLYVADNQAFAGGNKISRLLKVNMKDGKPGEIETVAEGFMMANGIDIRKDYIYVNETNIDAAAMPMISGTYRFKLSELSGKTPIKVTGVNDPHFFLKVETKYANDNMKVGANGLTFDSKGNMYVCNFGEAAILKVTFKDDDSIDKVSTLCKGQGLESTDGLHIDQNDNLWTADFMGNAIGRICTKTGKVCVIAKNAPGDGTDGALDAPSECIRRGDRIYVSNIDITYGPNTADTLQTVSVIDLKCGSKDGPGCCKNREGCCPKMKDGSCPKSSK